MKQESKTPSPATRVLPLGKGEKDLAGGFGEMVAGLKKSQADKWQFWKDVVDECENMNYRLAEPVRMQTTPPQPSPKGREQKQMVLVLKCRDSVVRFELYREQFELMARLNESLEKLGQKERIGKIVFR